MTLVSSDRVRKELARIAPAATAVAETGAGLYTGASTARVYAEMLHRAATLLRRGESVVLDATWGSSVHRDLARGVALDCSADLVEIHCQAPAAVADARLTTRMSVSAAGTVSDATPMIAADLRADFEEWPAAWSVDTTRPLSDTYDEAAALVRPHDRRAVDDRPRSLIEPD
jgi:predicted kinase